jgi:hypothetical protein
VRTKLLAAISVAVCSQAQFAAAVPLFALQPVRSAGPRSDTVVRMVAAPRHSAPRLVLELSVGGTAAAQPEANFANVVGILPLQDGSLLIMDRPLSGSPFVRRFDAQGRFIGNVGRVGQGPGEFRRPFGMVQLSNGNIVIGDNGAALKVFSASGSPLHDWRIPDVGTSFSTDTSGALFHMVSFGGSSSGNTVTPATYGLRRISAAGEGRDTILLTALPQLDVPTFIVRAPCGEGSGECIAASARLPFAPEVIWAWSPLGYFVTGTNSSYTIDLRIPRPGSPRQVWEPGDPVISLRRTVQPVRISNEERADSRSAITARLQAADPRWTWTGPDVPTTKPAFSRIFVGLDGRIWVAAAAASERMPAGESVAFVGGFGLPSPKWRQPRLLDVFEPSGSYLGQVQLPYDASPSAMRGDNIWMIAQDGDGVHSVRRYRVDWGS